MLLYEVNLEVAAEIKNKYESWLPGHIERLLRFPGFVQAFWFERSPEDEQSQSSASLWTIHYTVEDRQALDEYLDKHAAEVRQEAIDLFGDKFKATRRILNFRGAIGGDL